MDSISGSIHSTESWIVNFPDPPEAARDSQVTFSPDICDLRMAGICCANSVKMLTNNQFNRPLGAPGQVATPLAY